METKQPPANPRSALNKEQCLLNNSAPPVKIFFGGWAIHLETLQGCYIAFCAFSGLKWVHVLLVLFSTLHIWLLKGCWWDWGSVRCDPSSQNAHPISGAGISVDVCHCFPLRKLLTLRVCSVELFTSGWGLSCQWGTVRSVWALSGDRGSVWDQGEFLTSKIFGVKSKESIRGINKVI